MSQRHKPVEGNATYSGEDETATSDGLDCLIATCSTILEAGVHPHPDEEQSFYKILRYCYKLVSSGSDTDARFPTALVLHHCAIPYLDGLIPESVEFCAYLCTIFEFIVAVPGNDEFRRYYLDLFAKYGFRGCSNQFRPIQNPEIARYLGRLGYMGDDISFLLEFTTFLRTHKTDKGFEPWTAGSLTINGNGLRDSIWVFLQSGNGARYWPDDVVSCLRFSLNHLEILDELVELTTRLIPYWKNQWPTQV